MMEDKFAGNGTLPCCLRTIAAFFKKETVLCIAVLLALASMCIVPVSDKYAGYIDCRVLALLFSLMLVVAGLQKEGVFEYIMQSMLVIVTTTRRMVLLLVLSSFFLSMWITNDVALITLVPFAIMMLTKAGRQSNISFVVVMQTIAANLGSMCTPVGNPQNLYLYTISSMQPGQFIITLMPYTLLSLVMITGTCMLVKNETVTVDTQQTMNTPKKRKWVIAVYVMLFAVCIATVLHIMDYRIMLVIVIAAVAFIQPRLLLTADYGLLITFMAFFIFVGNIRQLDTVQSLLNQSMSGHEIIVSVLASQVISNVPAAVLLSGFTDNFTALLIGTNIGGLGTLIASMASLISYKFYAKTNGCDIRRYMVLFTVINVIYLIILVVAAIVLNRIY